MNEFVVTINDRKYVINISENGQVSVGNKHIETEITRISSNTFLFRYGKKVFEISTNKLSGDKYSFLICGWYLETTVRTALQESANELRASKNQFDHAYEIKAPMPGLIIKLNKKIGDTVAANEAVLLLEAMKMENEIRSPREGTIKNIFYLEGQSVDKGSVVLTIE